MRKFFIILLLFVSTLGFSQEYVEDMNGFDWVNWRGDAKVAFMQGFFSAYSSVGIRYYEEAEMEGREVSSEEMSFLREYFYFPITVREAVDRVDTFYQNYDNRRYNIIEVILLAGGKDYWNRD